MKSNQNGFVSILAIVLRLAGIGVAGYYIVSQKENQPLTPTTHVSENFGQNDTSQKSP